MPGWAVVLGLAGLIAGPTGIGWALLNWRSDNEGKKISQTGELVAMFQKLIDELEAALDRAVAAVRVAEEKANGAAGELQACRLECRRLRGELAAVEYELERVRDER